jgi:transposase-like protein
MIKEVKKLKDHLILLQDEKTLVATLLSNVVVVQENMGDKPIQTQKAINFLNSQSKRQLQFVGIQDNEYLIAQAKKYIAKDALAKEETMKANFLITMGEQFKHMFKNVFDNGFPNFWNEEGAMIVESDYLSLW